jgi:hypothetical protein
MAGLSFSAQITALTSLISTLTTIQQDYLTNSVSNPNGVPSFIQSSATPAATYADISGLYAALVDTLNKATAMKSSLESINTKVTNALAVANRFKNNADAIRVSMAITIRL